MLLSKLLERVVARQLTTYLLNTADLIPACQSAYRQHHSIETALLKIRNEALMVADKGMVTLDVLLDYSAAFDAVDHSVMLQILEKRRSLSGTALQRHATYLQSRTCAVVAGGVSSDTVPLECSSPQGSSLGPLKFVIYAAELYMNLSLDTASWSTAPHSDESSECHSGQAEYGSCHSRRQSLDCFTSVET